MGGFDPRRRDSLSARAALLARVVHVHDVAAEPRYSSEGVSLGKVRTGLALPLLREGTPIGVLGLARQRVEPFTSKQIELVRTFADQAVIAIENTRLITETREALEQQTATAEILQVINRSPGDLAPVFEAIVDKATSLCTAAYGALRIFDGEFFNVAAVRGEPEWVAQVRRGGARGGGMFFEPIAHGERFVNIADVRESALYRTEPYARQTADLGGVRS